ncbi:hypothetical protein [Oligella urethralis]|uniref:hypothetical protein n=1 Tax=Oligella urethralis TaxID=90245 RepID=UPI00242D7E01|nr:hypothetical protein [Oligella urethralis]
MLSLLTSDHQHSTPHLDKKGLAVFEKYVAQANCYVEYGAGASTWHAHELGAKQIIAVDSSAEWIHNVQAHLPDSKQVELIHCDIGPVGQWGKPMDDRKIKHYHEYMLAPWRLAQQKGLQVDLIMIDGRFRVACFLYSLLCAEAGTVILFDDYSLRFRYHLVEDFCPKVASHGRLAEFHVSKDYELSELVAMIAKYSIIID